jgi:hypothetical protein
VQSYRKHDPETANLPHEACNQLRRSQPERGSVKIGRSKDPVSAERILQMPSGIFTEKTKRILAVFFSYAVLHLHGTPWLRSSSGSGNIVFFENASTILIKPHVQSNFSQDGTSTPSISESDNVKGSDEMDDDKCFDDFLSHPSPCLVNLAIVLFELYMNKSIHTLAKRYSVSVSDENNGDLGYLHVVDIFEKCNLDITEQFCVAVDKCLDSNIGLDAKGNDLDEYGLRSVIYQEIVRRLEDELDQGYSYLSGGDLDLEAQKIDLEIGAR